MIQLFGIFHVWVVAGVIGSRIWVLTGLCPAKIFLSSTLTCETLEANHGERKITSFFVDCPYVKGVSPPSISSNNSSDVLNPFSFNIFAASSLEG